MDLKRATVKPYDKYKFELVNSFNFAFDIKIKGQNVRVSETVQKGYITDGASIPRIFWCFYPPYKSEYFGACVIHDYLCCKALGQENIREAYKIADLCFKEALKALKVNNFTCFTFYHSVNAYHSLKCLMKGHK